MTAILAALTAAFNAYAAWVRWQIETEQDRLEDEIDTLAADGSPAAKLRLERLAQRLKRKREQFSSLRSTDSHDAPRP